MVVPIIFSTTKFNCILICTPYFPENISSEKVTEENKLNTEPQIYQQRIKKISAEKTVNDIPNSSDRPPDFILKPHSVKVEEGKSAIFLCRPQGNPHPTVQWLKQGNLLENNDRIQVFVFSVLLTGISNFCINSIKSMNQDQQHS